ncbi:MAG: efflux RND transporter periplasmic adaptor subunit [Phycisphaerales bacterium]
MAYDADGPHPDLSTDRRAKDHPVSQETKSPPIAPAAEHQAPEDRTAKEAGPPRRSSSPGVNRGLMTGVRVLVIFVLIVGSIGIFVGLSKLKPASKPRTDPPAPVLVKAVQTQPRSIDRAWEGYGTAVSMRRSQVAAEVTGRVIERPRSIEAGGKVDAGGLLVALDSTDYKAALARAEQGVLALRARLDGLAVESERLATQLELVSDEIAAAERDLARTREAVEQGAGSQGEIDQKISALRRSQREQQSLRQAQELVPSRRMTLEGELGGLSADLEVAKKNLERTRVSSPIAGEIESVTPRVGDWVLAGTPVASIVDVTRLEIPLRIPASAASWIAVGDSVSIWSGEPVGIPNHTGRVTRLGPSTDAATRTITVFVEVVQDRSQLDRLLPGTFVHGRVSSPDPQSRVVVPRRAIRSERVMTLTPVGDGFFTVSPVRVRTAYALDGQIESLDPSETEWAVLEPVAGLADGVLIATTSIELLVPGAQVRVDDGSDVQPEIGQQSSSEEGVRP